MYRSQQVLTYNAFIQYNSILVVITFPRHISHQQVFTQCKLTTLSWISFSQDITLLHTLSFITSRTEVNGHALISLTEFRNSVFLQSRFKAYKFFIFISVIQDTNSCCIDIFYNTITLCCNLSTRVFNQLFFNTCTYNRSLCTQQRNCLAHHVWSHQCTVSIVMFQERNQRSSDRSNLLWRNIHQLYLVRSNNRIISITTSFYFLTNKFAFIIQWSITLSDYLILFLFGCQIFNTFIRYIHLTISYFTIRSWNKAKFINLSIHTQRRNQTDIRTFRSFNRTQTTIMSIVYVTNLKTSTFTWQTTRS